MSTTIKVSNEVRDRLKAQAALAHTTLGRHLEHLAGLGEREARMTALRAAMRPTSPEDLAPGRDCACSTGAACGRARRDVYPDVYEDQHRDR
jgi:hypothetical protein